MRELVRTNDAVLISAIEALLKTLTPALTLIVVTHNLGQATRVSDDTMFFYQGDLERKKLKIQPIDDELDAARALLEDAGFANEIRRDGR